MSEDKFHFRIKRGDVEIEYDGKSEEVASKFLEAFEWLENAPATVTLQPKPIPTTPEPGKEKSKRGGARTSVISPAIDDLIKEGFLDDFKNSSQVLEELRRKAVPVSDINPVNMALGRKVPKTLDRIKDDQGRWVYRKKT